MPPGLRKSGIPELGADAGAGEHDGLARTLDDHGRVRRFRDRRAFHDFGKTRAARQALLWENAPIMSDCTAYLAAEGFVDELAHELGTVDRRHGRLLIAAGPPRPAAWAANVWLDPQEIQIASITDAARKLRAIQRNWSAYAPHLHRRAMLDPGAAAKGLRETARLRVPPPAAPLGSWTLLDAETMLAAPRCTSPFPNGEVRFVEDRTGPPSRAYLKLWEALTLIGRRPEPGERCLDLGSSPGGWSWALQQMGAQVVSVDKAPLAPADRAPAGDRTSAGERLRARPAHGRPGRLAVLRCRVLSGAAPGTGRALARRRDLPPLRLHDQVPGRDRSRDGPPLCRHPRLDSCAISFTTSTS